MKSATKSAAGLSDGSTISTCRRAEHVGDRRLLLLAVDRILGGRLDVARLTRLRFLCLAISPAGSFGMRFGVMPTSAAHEVRAWKGGRSFPLSNTRAECGRRMAVYGRRGPESIIKWEFPRGSRDLSHTAIGPC